MLQDHGHTTFETRRKLLKMHIRDTNVTINVENIDNSISFYKSIGFTLINRWSNHYAQLSAPGIKVGLHPTHESIRHRNSGVVSIGFTTEDFEETKASLKQLGIAVTERKEAGGEFLHFNDPDGTALYFIAPQW